MGKELMVLLIILCAIMNMNLVLRIYVETPVASKDVKVSRKLLVWLLVISGLACIALILYLFHIKE